MKFSPHVPGKVANSDPTPLGSKLDAVLREHSIAPADASEHLRCPNT